MKILSLSLRRQWGSYYRRMRSPTLLISIASDVASVNLRSAVLKWPGWQLVSTFDECEVHALDNAYLMHFVDETKRMTHLDDVDEWFAERFVPPADVVFLSKHTAASGTPALCVHPIGVAAGAEPVHGGISGNFPPPSPLIAPLYRALRRQRKVTCSSTGKVFETTLEASHHGPVLATPSCFVEIGSGDEQYHQPDPATLWAEILRDVIFVQKADETEVFISIGGGHYQPKICDYVAKSEASVHVGHMLASYNFKGAEDVDWQRTIRAAADSTQKHYSTPLTARVEKKAFNGASRQKVVDFLDRESIRYTLF